MSVTFSFVVNTERKENLGKLAGQSCNRDKPCYNYSTGIYQTIKRNSFNFRCLWYCRMNIAEISFKL